MGFVEELEEAAGRVAKVAGPAVVRIGRGRGRGAGVVIGDGVVLTNAHNLRGSEVTVTFLDGTSSTGTVSGVDVDGDLAVVRVEGTHALAIAWAAREAREGTPVFGVTVPYGAGTRVTFGTVSAVGRAFRGPGGRLISGGLEHTAPLARGSSGSPLVDIDGKLLGVSTHRLGDGFYLAQPADAEFRRRVDALTRGESPRRRYLGVALAPPGAARRLRGAVGLPERDGLLVRGVDEDGPAARAGIRRGDFLTEASDRPLRGPEDLFEALDRVADEAPLSLRLVRGNEEMQVQVSFGDVSHEGSA